MVICRRAQVAVRQASSPAEGSAVCASGCLPSISHKLDVGSEGLVDGTRGCFRQKVLSAIVVPTLPCVLVVPPLGSLARWTLWLVMTAQPLHWAVRQ